MQTGRANPPVASIPQTPELVPVTTLPPRGTSDGKRGWGRRLLLADILWKDSNGNPRRGLHSECPTKQAGLCQEGEEIAPGDGRTIETAHFDLPGVQHDIKIFFRLAGSSGDHQSAIVDIMIWFLPKVIRICSFVAPLIRTGWENYLLEFLASLWRCSFSTSDLRYIHPSHPIHPTFRFECSIWSWGGPRWSKLV